MSIRLDTPYLEDGIHSTHFFNGRLLSGEDLHQEQLARGEWLKLLGRSIGEGIVHGLEVSAPIGASSTAKLSVKVGPGLALNREGQALVLRDTVEVLLAPAGKPRSVSTTGPGDFQDCLPSANLSVTGTGLYLLTLAPDEGYVGRAPVSGLGPNEPACNAKQRVAGVRFRLLKLQFDAPDPLESRLRNRVAHLCFGTKDPRRLAALVHPFGKPPERYGLLDDHRRPDALTGQDVPLALLYWQERFGIHFMDMGAVRRRPTRVEHTGRWAPWLGERRASEAEAVLLQFQEHLQALLDMDEPEKVRATTYFDYLPPAGVLPLKLGAFKGFSAETFFQGIPWRKYVIEGEHLQPLLRQSLAHAPIELPQDPEPAQGSEPVPREFLWVYLIRQNQQALTEGQGVQPYLVFASGHLPYRGDSRADVARAEYAHVALPRPGEEPPAW